VQISDSHIGFNKEANPDPVKTLQVAIDKVIALPKRPSLILHTGDITHLSKPAEFDTAAQLLKALPSTVHYVPGEHDTLDEGGGQLYLERYGKGTKGNGWYSFDDHGVHFIALVNVFNFKLAMKPPSAPINSPGWPTTCAVSAAHPSSCSPTFRCGRFISRGAGAPRTAIRRSRCCAMVR
jgi:hypothetical protein